MVRGMVFGSHNRPACRYEAGGMTIGPGSHRGVKVDTLAGPSFAYFPFLNSFNTCTRSLPSLAILISPTPGANQSIVLVVPATDSTRIAWNLPAGTSTSS